MIEIKTGVPVPVDATARSGPTLYPWAAMQAAPGCHFDLTLRTPLAAGQNSRLTEYRKLRNRVNASFYGWRNAPGKLDRRPYRVVVRAIWKDNLLRAWMIPDSREAFQAVAIEAQAANHVPGPPMPDMPPAWPVQAPAAVPKPAPAAVPASEPAASAEPEPEATDFGDW